MTLAALLAAFGPFALALVGVIVFIENGLLFPFLPGDTLLFGSAVIAAAIGVSPWVVVAVAAVAAILGGEAGFAIGRRYGRRWFRPDARVLRTRYVDDTERFFARWGTPAIVLARFVAIARTFVAPAAGMSTMPHRTFSAWNAASGVAWACLVGLVGHLLGAIPWVAAHIEWIMIGMLALPGIPLAITAARRARRTPAPVDATVGA
ncbi:DedA family protein [Demequina soli]|uniref:DedA family protein n=1 Tax=Demequina soli TaxID=1638987 RepID=UPI000783A02E|nr:VTT domain-containing protein [Demequina soli]